MKYVVKNCPAYDYDKEFDYHICKQPLIPYECSVDNCQDCTDCVIKQVIEKATETINATFNNECFDFAQEILDMFEIERVKE